MIRSFLALPIPEETGDILIDAQDETLDIRWTPFDNLHLTLVFMGDVEEPALADLNALLSAMEAPALDLTIRGVGAFGSARPRLVYAALDPCAALLRLQSRLVRLCEAAGIGVEARKYVPHVTLGRPRSGAAVRDWLEDWSGLSVPAFRASEVVLYRSDLGRGHPVYTAMARYPLG